MRLGGRCLRLGCRRLADAERHPPFRGAQLQHFDGHFVPHLYGFGGFAHTLGSEFAHRYEPFDARLQPHERPRCHHSRHPPLCHLFDAMVVVDMLPGVGKDLLATQRHPPALRVHLQDEHFNLLTGFQHLRGVTDAGPVNLGHMQ